MPLLTGYIGTYFSPESRGVYRFSYDTATGTPGTPALFYEARDAKCAALAGGVLAAPIQEGERAGVVLLRTAPGQPAQLLAKALPERVTASYLAFEGDYLYAANYKEGSVMVYDRRTLSTIHRIETAPEAGCHQILFHGVELLVPCLRLDRVKRFSLRDRFAFQGELSFPQGTGPRHGVFNRAHTRFYLLSELSSTLFSYRVDGASFKLLQTLPLLPPGVSGASAAVRLSGDERFLYLSTREEANLLSVVRVTGEGLELIQQVSCGGVHPRDFILAPDGGFLLCLNRDAGGLVSFPVDRTRGTLGAPVARVPIAQGSGLLLSDD